MKFKTLLTLLLIFLFFLHLASCDKFEGEQTIPAYLRIDSIALKTMSPAQGSANSRITDAWVYINEQLIGAFELPATIPILSQGSCRLKIKPGIRLDGMVQLRSYYPMYTDIERNITLTPDEITLVTGQEINGKQTLYTTYNEKVQFVWAENFEDSNLALDTVSQSETDFQLTTEVSETFEGQHSGKIILTKDKDMFESWSSESLSLPRNGYPVFLEMNYRCTNTFTVGIVAIGADDLIQSPILNLSPTDKWNKIYINLTPNVSSTTTGLKFQIFLGALLDENLEQGTIWIDNLKLVYLDKSSGK
ncbi:MAG: hypothetical protein PWR20_930 [Bacteroidales bacterium]|jgi:hypothetical protein|nr:hypothetical protein [Bacteroidales bacterium]MDN5329903.1 hypothetical protein [Bacteroidales bacterium]